MDTAARGRALIAAALLLTALTACEPARESLLVRADGGATFTWTLVVTREQVESGLFGSTTWPIAEECGTDGFDAEQFVLSTFALVEFPDGWRTTTTCDDVRVVAEITVSGLLEDVVGDLRQHAVHPVYPSVLPLVEVDRTGADWSISSAPEPVDRRLDALASELRGAATPEIEVGIEVEGDVIEHDADAIDGDTYLWHWTAGDPGRPSISLSWRPGAAGHETIRPWVAGGIVCTAAVIGAATVAIRRRGRIR